MAQLKTLLWHALAHLKWQREEVRRERKSEEWRGRDTEEREKRYLISNDWKRKEREREKGGVVPEFGWQNDDERDGGPGNGGERDVGPPNGGERDGGHRNGGERDGGPRNGGEREVASRKPKLQW